MSVRSARAKGLVAHVERRVRRRDELRLRLSRLELQDPQRAYLAAQLVDVQRDLVEIQQLTKPKANG